jgi:hypothetical protein
MTKRIRLKGLLVVGMVGSIAWVATPAAAAVVIGTGPTDPPVGERTARPCAGGVCMNVYRRPGRPRVRVVRMTFSGSAVSHYNVRQPEPGGRMVQWEVLTRHGGTNESKGWEIFENPGSKYRIQVQACVRGGPFQRSTCTTWKRLTVRF